MKKRGLVKGIIIFALIAVAVVAVLAFTYRSGRSSRALPVDTYLVEPVSLEETVSGTGSFVPQKSSTVYARISGLVEQIPVETGDKVEKGQLLVQLDQSDYQRAVMQAQSALEAARRTIVQSLTTLRAAYRNAQTAYEQAKRNYDKNRELFQVNAVSEETLNQAQDALQSAEVNLRSAREQLNLRLGIAAEADPSSVNLSDEEIVSRAPEVEQARVSLESARVNLGRTSITSPQAGTVTQIMPSEGDLITQNSPLVKIESLSEMLAEVQIDEVDIGKISEGSEAVVTSDSLLGETIDGTVLEIAPVISQVGNTRVSLVKIELNEGERRLKAGASCTARITTQVKEDVLAIPIDAFVIRNNLSYAYVLTAEGEPEAGDEALGISGGTGSAPEEGEERIYTLEERQIETGISTISRIEVKEGLSAGELIVQGNLEVLHEGMQVIPKAELAGRAR